MPRRRHTPEALAAALAEGPDRAKSLLAYLDALPPAEKAAAIGDLFEAAGLPRPRPPAARRV